MHAKPDIVSLKWVSGLINQQAERAEAFLVSYSRNFSDKKPLLQCMWSIHQITATLRFLGMRKGEMLTLEMERSLNHIYKEQLQGERRKLVLGGLMQGIKVLPAYLAHTQNARQETGQGLDQYVNDLRRWLGIKPRPHAFFFHMDISPDAGISKDADPAEAEEIIDRCGVMLSIYLQAAKSALRRERVVDSMKTVARVARKMQIMFAGSPAERFWYALIGLCEGIAGGLIVPDECVAQLFKTGAFMIKHARENGDKLDPAIDLDDNLQQLLYYIASCKSRPVHIQAIRDSFGIDEHTLDRAHQGLVHLDALVTALNGALERLNSVTQHLNAIDPQAKTIDSIVENQEAILSDLEAAGLRLEAAGQVTHARSVSEVRQQLGQLYRNAENEEQEQDSTSQAQGIDQIIRRIVDVKLDIEHKLEHGMCSSFCSREFELRESVVNATFNQMSLVENYLQQVLRRKALNNALVRKPADQQSLDQLTLALNRHLNKTDSGHEALRQALSEAHGGDRDLDLLYQLACDFRDGLEGLPERHALKLSLQLMLEISGALDFAGLQTESAIIERCRTWLETAFKAGAVHENEAFACFAEAFAQLEMHLQRSIIDPLDESPHLLQLAEKRAEELDTFAADLSNGADVVTPLTVGQSTYVEDTELPPQLREVFIEESEELIDALEKSLDDWISNPEDKVVLREMRRHFHTFKGNGRAVGANIIGELGWAAQDLLDRVLDGDLAADMRLRTLVSDVITALPGLVMSFRSSEGLDVETTRKLTNRCFELARRADMELADELPSSDSQASLTSSDTATTTVGTP